MIGLELIYNWITNWCRWTLIKTSDEEMHQLIWESIELINESVNELNAHWRFFQLFDETSEKPLWPLWRHNSSEAIF